MRRAGSLQAASAAEATATRWRRRSGCRRDGGPSEPAADAGRRSPTADDLAEPDTEDEEAGNE